MLAAGNDGCVGRSKKTGRRHHSRKLALAAVTDNVSSVIINWKDHEIREFRVSGNVFKNYVKNMSMHFSDMDANIVM